MARTYDRSASTLAWPEPPKIGSVWTVVGTPRIQLEVVAIRGPQWKQSVLWKRLDIRGEGVTSVQAFFRTFMVAIQETGEED